MLDGLKRQLRSVIEWEDPHPDQLFWRWSENGDEIKNASKLILGPGQGCIFVYEGQIRAVHQREGMMELHTANLPFWTTVTKSMQFFQSEHKTGIYFFARREIVDQKWGTPAPVKYEEPKYGIPAALRAHGNFSYLVAEPESFYRALVGGQALYRISDARAVLADRIVQSISDYVAEARPPYLEIDARREEIAAGILVKVGAEFQKLGLKALDFRIEGADFDDETRARIKQIGDRIAATQEAKAAGLSYVEMQKLDALRDAARNQGGAAGAGVGLGAGMALSGAMAESLGAPKPGSASQRVEERLQVLLDLYQKKLIGEEEFQSKRKEILAAL